ncbi:thioredoxin [Saccharopolyspora subtropica]|uniref:NifU family protein n=1 Tax=Saccharopolyspora thermophila TaxID=89367 RepID=A0A917JU03_9PSEU|nr:NifU family protein [Saccharopolyspora subtropica]GGI87056.1 thioredoxin [Saccharopolyspora subtropica]
MADRGGLDDEAVRARLARVDALLEVVEQAPGPTSDAALEAVRELVEVYGEALARLVRLDARSSPRTVTDDELLNHLLVLHDLHPDPVGERVRRALDDVRPHARRRGVQVELVDVDGSVARIRLSGGCGCSSPPDEVAQAVAEAVRAVAPELTDVDVVAAEQGASVISVDAVLSRARRPG